ncbi:MAG TPA: lectin-like protein, partial [Prosthecobacter sp.]|nr:lectin-like protein [Prosthecobacter sp.]
IVTYRPERRSALPAFIVGVLLAAGAYFAWQKFRDRSPLAEGASSIVAATSSQPNTGDTATTPASSADQSSTRPAPADALAFGGHRYKFVLGDVTWDEAEARSEGMGGHLATLTTPEEDEWVRKTFADPLPPERLLYIGAHKAAESNTWQWVTGEAWAFENWRKSSKPADSPERLGGTYHRYVDAAQWAAGWNPARKIAIPSGPEQGLPRTMGYLVEWDHDLTYAPVSARDKATLTFGGHRYLWVAAKGITLSEAKESAHNAGGYLVTITSAAENDFVMALTTKFNGQTWTGGLRATRGRNGWIWMNGEAFSFPGPPTEWQSSTAPGDAITVMSGTWNDYESPTRSPNIAGFIVEWGAPRTPPPADALVFGSNRYKVLPDKSLTWTQANAAAEAMGGHLATITTKEENDWISASFIAKVERGLGLWIGGTSQGTPGKWRWVTGEPFDFTSWIPGEPSNNSFEPAITFTNNDAGVIGWGDIKDDGFGKRDRRAGFIAEWEADTAPGPSAASSIDLLAGVDVKRDALVGQWEVTPDGLVTTMQNGGKSQVLEFDHSTPEEYNFEIEFTVTAGTREVVQVLPLPTHSIIWKMGPERKDPAPYGFGPILDGANITSGTRTEAMTHLPRLKIGQRYRCLLEVRKGSLRAVLDGAEIVKWSGDLMRLNWEPIWQLRNPRHLGIAAYTSSVIFHKAELSPVVVESPRLAELKAQFDNAFERDVTKVYRTALSDLDSKYLAAVDRALADATKIGRLEEAVALQEEKQRLADRQPLPAADPVNVTAGLKKLRDTYRSELTKLVRQRDAAANVVYTRYDQSLAALQTDFTQKNLLPDALAVKRRREALDKLRQPAAAPAMMVAAAGTSPTLSASMSLAAAPAQQKASPPKPPAQLVPDILKETPPKPFTQEEAIHWALSLNGSAKILKGKTEMDVLNLGSLPRGKYTLIGLKVGENQLIHVVSLAGLSELADLSELNLSNNFLTDDGLAFLPPLPKLTSLSLTNCRLSDASFEHLAKQPSLTHLRIGNNNITGVGLTSYPRASSLTSLTIGSGNLNDEGIAAITRCTALESLDVTCSKLTCTN